MRVETSLFVSEDVPPELLAGLRSADQPGGIAMYRLLRERILGLPSSLPGSMQTGGIGLAAEDKK